MKLLRVSGLALTLALLAPACDKSTTPGQDLSVASTDLAGADLTAGGGGLDPTHFAATWTGSWSNTTFGSTGAASNVVTVDSANKKITFVLDLDGNVFGAANPPAETFMGTYDANQYTVSGTSATFGTLTLTVTKDGTITGTATPTRGMTTLSGTTTETKMTINYAIKDPPNADIMGVLTLNKQ